MHFQPPCLACFALRSKPLFLHGLLLRCIRANYAVAAWRDEQTALVSHLCVSL
jgi:hypothetical protein